MEMKYVPSQKDIRQDFLPDLHTVLLFIAACCIVAIFYFSTHTAPSDFNGTRSVFNENETEYTDIVDAGPVEEAIEVPPGSN